MKKSFVFISLFFGSIAISLAKDTLLNELVVNEQMQKDTMHGFCTYFKMISNGASQRRQDLLTEVFGKEFHAWINVSGKMQKLKAVQLDPVIYKSKTLSIEISRSEKKALIKIRKGNQFENIETEYWCDGP